MTQLIILGLHCIFTCSLVACALEAWQEWDSQECHQPAL